MPFCNDMQSEQFTTKCGDPCFINSCKSDECTFNSHAVDVLKSTDTCMCTQHVGLKFCEEALYDNCVNQIGSFSFCEKMMRKSNNKTSYYKCSV